MTARPADPAVTLAAYRRYLAREHEARDGYLHVTDAAHREYLTGPWPDRASYEVVERQAWLTYYAAGRAAWRTYTAELEQPPPPPPAQPDIPIPVYPADHRTDQEAQMPRRPAFYPYPESES